ncbi:unnamed protein product [Gulo gulo]|uniref:Uncharacterized protein n=1 Tax=Gulo gulo TaxID=48420 RepID=A0A9X9Q2N6_GULGU|nr:unnamed protein product [Gulo gulo]
MTNPEQMYLKNEIGAEERKQDEDWIWGVTTLPELAHPLPRP